MKPSGLADSPLFHRKSMVEVNKMKRKKQGSARQHASMTPRYHDSMIASIAKSVREVGKEGCTYRLTQREKNALFEIIYHFRKQNRRLSENDIARIAINFLIEDFKMDDRTCLLKRIHDFMQS